ncbi:hypothetical protein ABZX40_39100 [Streptomyces sp. NPDC004610]|uniref:hypothetical protein n=1 Tax=unclassified Streptomyces TaxID=2593676 RepID=UPI0033A07C43
MASDALNGLFLVLTGQQMPDADPELMRAHLVVPQRELEQRLTEVQELLVRVVQSVAGESNGTFSEAYYEAMMTLAQPDGQAVLAGLRDAARQLGDAMEESAYQVEYLNLMIVFQLGMFLVEFAATFVMALFNPAQALMRQAFLRNHYGKILSSLWFRVLLAIAEQQVLQVGLAVAMDRLAQWTLARQGKHSAHGKSYLVQAVAFGSVAGFVAVPVQFAASWLAQNLTKRTAHGAGDRLFGELDRALASHRGGPAAKGGGDGADARGDGPPGPKPVPRPRPGQDPDGFTGKTLTATGGGTGGRGADREFARGFSGQVSGVVERLSRAGDPGAAARSFTEGMGDVFARRFADDLAGDGPARELGENWAGAFLRNLDHDGMGDALRSVLRDGRLPVTALGDDAVRVMSERVAHWFGPRGWGGAFLGFTVQGIGDGVTGVGAEVVYNGITQQKVSVSGTGFLTSAFSERFAEGLNMGAERLAAKVRLPDVALGGGLNLDTALDVVKNPAAEGPGRTSTTSTGDDNDSPREVTAAASAPVAGPTPAPAPAFPGGDSATRLHAPLPGTGIGNGPFGTPATDDTLNGSDPSDVAMTPTVPVMPVMPLTSTGVVTVGIPVAEGPETDAPAATVPVIGPTTVTGPTTAVGPLTVIGPLAASPTPVPVPTPTPSPAPSLPPAPVPEGEGVRQPLNSSLPSGVRPSSADRLFTTLAPGADTTAVRAVPAQPVDEVRQTVRRLEALARSAGMSDSEISRLTREAATTVASGDGRGTEERIRVSLDGIRAHVLDRQQAAVHAHIAAGQGKPVPYGVPHPHWQTAADAVRHAQRSGDIRLVAESLRRYAALIGAHPAGLGENVRGDTHPSHIPAATRRVLGLADVLNQLGDPHTAPQAVTAHSPARTVSEDEKVPSRLNGPGRGRDPVRTAEGAFRVLSADDSPTGRTDGRPADDAHAAPHTTPHPVPSTREKALAEAVRRVVQWRADTAPADAPTRPRDCAVLLARFTREMYLGDAADAVRPPDRGQTVSGIRPARAVDDIVVGTGRTDQQLATGPGWARLDDWDTVLDALNRAGEGSTALILTRGTHDIGHAYAVHQVDGTDSGARWIELQAATPDRQIRTTPSDMVLANTRAIVVDGSGRVLPGVLWSAPGRSLADALTDPPRTHTFGATGEGSGQPSAADPPPPAKTQRDNILGDVTAQALADFLDIHKFTLIRWAKPPGPPRGAKRVAYVAALALIMEGRGLHLYDGTSERAWYDTVITHPGVARRMDRLRPALHAAVVFLPPLDRRIVIRSVPRQVLADLMNVDIDDYSEWERNTRIPRGQHRVDFAALSALMMEFRGLEHYAGTPERTWYDVATAHPAVELAMTAFRDDVRTRFSEMGAVGPPVPVRPASPTPPPPLDPPRLPSTDQRNNILGRFTQKQLADVLRVHRQTVGNWGNLATEPQGPQRVAYVAVLALIMEFRGVYLFADTSEGEWYEEVVRHPEVGEAMVERGDDVHARLFGRGVVRGTPDGTSRTPPVAPPDPQDDPDSEVLPLIRPPEVPGPLAVPAAGPAVPRTGGTGGTGLPYAVDPFALVQAGLRQAAAEDGLEILDLGGEGDCFFSALSWTAGLHLTPDTMRAQLGASLQARLDTTGSLGPDIDAVLNRAHPVLTHAERADFVLRLRTPRLWDNEVGDITPELAAHFYGVRIGVISASPGGVYRSVHGVSGPLVRLGQLQVPYLYGHWVATIDTGTVTLSGLHGPWAVSAGHPSQRRDSPRLRDDQGDRPRAGGGPAETRSGPPSPVLDPLFLPDSDSGSDAETDTGGNTGRDTRRAGSGPAVPGNAVYPAGSLNPDGSAGPRDLYASTGFMDFMDLDDRPASSSDHADFDDLADLYEFADFDEGMAQDQDGTTADGPRAEPGRGGQSQAEYVATLNQLNEYVVRTDPRDEDVDLLDRVIGRGALRNRLDEIRGTGLLSRPALPHSVRQRVRLRGRISGRKFTAAMGATHRSLASWEDTGDMRDPSSKHAVSYAAAMAVVAEHRLSTRPRADDAQYLLLSLAHPAVRARMGELRGPIQALLNAVRPGSPSSSASPRPDDVPGTGADDPPSRPPLNAPAERSGSLGTGNPGAPDAFRAELAADAHRRGLRLLESGRGPDSFFHALARTATPAGITGLDEPTAMRARFTEFLRREEPYYELVSTVWDDIANLIQPDGGPLAPEGRRAVIEAIGAADHTVFGLDHILPAVAARMYGLRIDYLRPGITGSGIHHLVAPAPDTTHPAAPERSLWLAHLPDAHTGAAHWLATEHTPPPVVPAPVAQAPAVRPPGVQTSTSGRRSRRRQSAAPAAPYPSSTQRASTGNRPRPSRAIDRGVIPLTRLGQDERRALRGTMTLAELGLIFTLKPKKGVVQSYERGKVKTMRGERYAEYTAILAVLVRRRGREDTEPYRTFLAEAEADVRFSRLMNDQEFRTRVLDAADAADHRVPPLPGPYDRWALRGGINRRTMASFIGMAGWGMAISSWERGVQPAQRFSVPYAAVLAILAKHRNLLDQPALAAFHAEARNDHRVRFLMDDADFRRRVTQAAAHTDQARRAVPLPDPADRARLREGVEDFPGLIRPDLLPGTVRRWQQNTNPLNGTDIEIYAAVLALLAEYHGWLGQPGFERLTGFVDTARTDERVAWWMADESLRERVWAALHPGQPLPPGAPAGPHGQAVPGATPAPVPSSRRDVPSPAQEMTNALHGSGWDGVAPPEPHTYDMAARVMGQVFYVTRVGADGTSAHFRSGQYGDSVYLLEETTMVSGSLQVVLTDATLDQALALHGEPPLTRAEEETLGPTAAPDTALPGDVLPDATRLGSTLQHHVRRTPVAVLALRHVVPGLLHELGITGAPGTVQPGLVHTAGEQLTWDALQPGGAPARDLIAGTAQDTATAIRLAASDALAADSLPPPADGELELALDSVLTRALDLDAFTEAVISTVAVQRSLNARFTDSGEEPVTADEYRRAAGLTPRTHLDPALLIGANLLLIRMGRQIATPAELRGALLRGARTAPGIAEIITQQRDPEHSD